MPFNKKYLFSGGRVLVPLFLGSMAYAMPGPAACLGTTALDLHFVSAGIVTDSLNGAEKQRFAQIAVDARSRIETIYGVTQSQPIMAFFIRRNGLGLFPLNSHGSTHFVGSRACILIGPDGQNVDVVAHELMHAEIHHRVGAFRRFLEIPTWFDEGVAMQVDHRSGYTLSSEDAHHIDSVRELDSEHSFFVSDDATLTRNYAASKAAVASLFSKTGTYGLYRDLARIRDGDRFIDIVEK